MTPRKPRCQAGSFAGFVRRFFWVGWGRREKGEGGENGLRGLGVEAGMEAFMEEGMKEAFMDLGLKALMESGMEIISYNPDPDIIFFSLLLPFCSIT